MQDNSTFLQHAVTLDNYWRSILLFGRNVASYKFALAQSLMELVPNSGGFVSMEELAKPYTRHLCEHLAQADKQCTSRSSKFLELCRSSNRGEVPNDKLISGAVSLGFANVIDAFHIVNQGEIPKRFFVDERRTRGGIVLTDELFELCEMQQKSNLIGEAEARWRLVETAWELNISRNLIQVKHDESTQSLYTDINQRRVDVTSSRAALNGYQKGHCFYCFAPIDIHTQSEHLADVDHFFPHTLKSCSDIPAIDGVWNLVLACKSCNRGADGKFARVPSLQLLERLNRRNEYLIGSHHPLRETLMRQTGSTPAKRSAFLQRAYNVARDRLVHSWEPVPQQDFEF